MQVNNKELLVTLETAKEWMDDWHNHGEIPDDATKIMAWEFSKDSIQPLLLSSGEYSADKFIRFYLGKDGSEVHLMAVAAELVEGVDNDICPESNTVPVNAAVYYTQYDEQGHPINPIHCDFQITPCTKVECTDAKKYVGDWLESGSLLGRYYESWRVPASDIYCALEDEGMDKILLYLAYEPSVDEPPFLANLLVVGGTENKNIYNFSKPCPHTCPGGKKITDCIMPPEK